MTDTQRHPHPIRAEDLDVTLAVRRDLGPEHDQAVINEFLDRVGAAIDARVDARLAERAPVPPQIEPSPPRQASVGLAIASIALGFLITTITMGTTHGSTSGVIATVLAWVAIALVNLAATRR